MNLRISSGELYKMLQISQNAISAKPPYPILADFLFHVEGSKLTITASDLEFTIISETDITPGDEGSFAFPSEILVNTLREMPEQPIELIHEEDTHGLTMNSSYGTYRSSSNDVEDYPKIPELEYETKVTLPGGRFLKALTTCAFAAATDEMKANMLGISVAFQSDAIEVAATDAHKMVKYTLFYNNEGIETNFVLPKKVITILKHTITDEDNLTVSFNKNHALFEYKNFKIYCKLIILPFPNYNGVIPLNNDKEIIVNRQEWLRSLKRITLYGNKTTYQTSFYIDNNEIKIETLDPDFSNEASEVIKCQYIGEPLELSYNAKFLIDSLSNLETEEVRLAVSNAGRAAILTPKENEVGENILMLVMPVRTRKASV
ncbi:MAG: DNA polymerase III subunit beta [Bacteroidetes bacterium]|jgi:DNA polymerase-3 subunit beta|nr:DNA polymerase III subunit beta [Bacteroidota bacterium]